MNAILLLVLGAAFVGTTFGNAVMYLDYQDCLYAGGLVNEAGQWVPRWTVKEVGPHFSRTVFDGDDCPTGQVKINGICVVPIPNARSYGDDVVYSAPGAKNCPMGQVKINGECLPITYFDLYGGQT